MTKDEIMQALRLTAMGRAGHPLQEELAEGLADMFVRVFEMQPGLPIEAKLASVASVEVAEPAKRARKTKAE